MSSRAISLVFFSLFLLVFHPWTLQAADISVQAELNSSEFTLDQAALLTVTVQGTQDAEVETPTGKGLQFSYQGSSKQFQWINGRSSSAIHFTYWVQADRTGTYTIDPVKVKVDGKIYQTSPLQCKVVAGGSTPAPGSGGGQQEKSDKDSDLARLAFLQLIPEKTTAYTGELIPFTLRLCLRRGIRANLRKAPQIEAEHLTLEELDERPRQSRQRIDGQECDVLAWHGLLAGVKAGTFDLKTRLDLTVLLRTRSRPSRDPWQDPFFNDPFFDRFLGSYVERKLSLETDPVAITIQDTPAKGRPPEYHGAVGHFSLAVSAKPTSLELGDPVTLKMIVSGTGNFNRVHAPELTDTKGWKVYPADSRTTGPSGDRNSKEFEQAIIPVATGVTEIPPLRFVFFDPDAGEYVILDSDPIPIHLEQKGQAAGVPRQVPVPPPGAADQKVDQRTGLAPQHREKGRTSPAILPIYQKPWFQLTALLAILLLCGASLACIWKQRQLRNPGLALAKSRLRQQKKLLADLDQAVKTGDSDHFLQLLRQTIRNHLALHWDREAEAITLADLEENLGRDAALARLFSRAEHGIYTREDLAPEEMGRILEELSRALEQDA